MMVDQPMESRIAKLESDVGYIKDQITDMKLDIRGIRGELKAANDSIVSLQKEMSGSVASLRAEVNGSIASLRAEVSGSIASLRAEVSDSIASLRKEVNGSISSLQREVSAVVATVANMESHYATKAELRALETHIIRWFVGTAIALTALAFTIARFVELPPPSAVSRRQRRLLQIRPVTPAL